jgi:acyl carrier protein/NAD(P)-dependent dehydrogenase (short-subunit alcohol dehydrogenase family)
LLRYTIAISVAGREVLRQQGVYLISGGLAGAGLVLAQSLAQSARPTLILIEHGAFPSSERWDELLADPTADDQLTAKIRRALALTQAGARVVVYGVDTTSAAQVRVVIAEAARQYGALHGAIYAAGFGHKQLAPIRAIAYQPDWWQGNTQVQGALAFAQALDRQELDFCLWISSLAAVLGGVMSVAYAAAYLLMDAYIYQRNLARPGIWTVVNLDSWHDPEQERAGLPATAHGAQFVITPAEATDVFRRIIAAPATDQLIVSTGTLADRLRQWIDRAPSQPAQRSAAGAAPHPRPRLQQAYVAPATASERRIAAIWQQAIGIDQVGVLDNFFDLGGDSLIAIQVIAQLKQALDRDIPVTSLYEGLTVRSLVALLELEPGGTEAHTPDRAQPSEREERITQRQRYQDTERLRKRALRTERSENV